ncbi:MAG: hypothetical protein JXP73_11690 [Deltaproteobacteria bacterium]|jgi:hypothetical protein|nr:hypothetical protein [Deltaproteobacteria bacterium]
MRSYTRSWQGLLVAALASAAALGLSGCGPDYAIFAVRVASANPRNDIASCQMTITDVATGAPVLSQYTLKVVTGTDSEGNLAIRQGCYGGLTPANVGTFSYSTSRSGGSLKFLVEAYADDSIKVVQRGEATAEVKPFPPEIPVQISMTRTD